MDTATIFLGLLAFCGPVVSVIIAVKIKNGGPRAGAGKRCESHAKELETHADELLGHSKELIEARVMLSNHLEHTRESLARIEGQMKTFEQKLDKLQQQA